MNVFGIQFAHDELSWLLFLPPALVFLMFRTRNIRRRFWKLLGLEQPDPTFEAPVNRRLKSFLFLLGFTAAVIAAIGPQWGQKAHPVKAQGLDMCFALDLSKSMWAEDLPPNRLGQAKNQLEIFLPRLGGDRAALVGFAGSAYVAAPLSVDHTALVTYLDSMNPETISDQATNLSAGVEACLSALGLDEIKDRNEILDDAARLIVLISDGEDTAEDDTGAVARAEKLGVPVFAMALGTEKGAPIPLREKGKLLEYVKDPDTNQPVVTKLGLKGLKSVAEKTGGKVFVASGGLEAWKSFEESIADFKRESRDAGTKLDKEDRFQWPLLFAFLWLLWDFALTEVKWRWMKPWVWVIFVGSALGLGASREARAFDSHTPKGVWFNNKGVKAFRKKDPKEAERNFSEALTEDAGDLDLRYNWAVNKLHGSIPHEPAPTAPTPEATAAQTGGAQGGEPEKPKVDEKMLGEALKELETLRADPRIAKPDREEFRRRLRYQLGQAYELKKDNVKALENYYASLTDKGLLLTAPPSSEGKKGAEPKQEAKAEGEASGKDDATPPHEFAPPKPGQAKPPKTLDEAAHINIARLLVAQQGDSGSSGQDKDQKKQDQDQKQDQKKENQPKDYGQDKQKAKFTGTDVSESEARQILESVSGEEKDVMKRKAGGEAKERAARHRRDSQDKGGGHRGKDW